MLHAKDLMVGDYLRINRDGLCIKKGTVVEVRGIDADEKLIEKGLIGSTHCRPLDKDLFDGGIWCDYLDPIPLTPEILEKNGFIYDPNSEEEDDGWWEWRNLGVETGNEFANIAFHDDDVAVYDLEILKGFSAINSHLDYVHELQHALRLCGIEKTIEL